MMSIVLTESRSPAWHASLFCHQTCRVCAELDHTETEVIKVCVCIATQILWAHILVASTLNSRTLAIFKYLWAHPAAESQVCWPMPVRL